MKTIKICLIVLLSSILFDDVTGDREKRASYNSFIAGHTLDPAAEPGYARFNRQQWIRWLTAQEIIHTQRYRQDHNGRLPNPPLTQKPIHTIAIGAPASFNVFGPLQPRNGRHIWSSRTFETYVYKNTRGNQRMWKCPALFILADVDSHQRPKHLTTICNVQMRTGNANNCFPTSRCTELF